MIHILLENPDITSPYLKDELTKIIKPEHKVTVVLFSFRDHQVYNEEVWQAAYNKKDGTYNNVYTAFYTFGIPEENIALIDYFTDTKVSARKKLKQPIFCISQADYLIV